MHSRERVTSIMAAAVDALTAISIMLVNLLISKALPVQFLNPRCPIPLQIQPVMQWIILTD